MYTIVLSCTVIIPYNLYCTHNSHNRICQVQQKTWYTHFEKAASGATQRQTEMKSRHFQHHLTTLVTKQYYYYYTGCAQKQKKPKRIQNNLEISEIIPQSVQQNSQLCVQLHTIYYNLTVTILLVMYKKSIGMYSTVR